jgi:hypothetical protein
MPGIRSKNERLLKKGIDHTLIIQSKRKNRSWGIKYMRKMSFDKW